MGRFDGVIDELGDSLGEVDAQPTSDLNNQASQKSALELMNETVTDSRRFKMGNNLTQAIDVDPDEHAEALQLSKETGLAPDLARQDLPGARKQVEQKSIDYAGLLEKNPKLSNSLTDPDFAKIARDDIDPLKFIEDAFKAQAHGFKQGREINELGRLGTEAAFGELSPEQQARAAELEQRAKHAPEFDGFVGGFIHPAAEIVGQMVDSFGKVLSDSVTSGGLAGALYRGAQNGFELSADDVAKGNVATNYLKDIFSIEAGHFYLDTVDLKDEDGEPIERELVQAGAATVGTINAALEIIGLGFVGKPAVAGLRKMIAEPVQGALQQASKSQAARNFLKAYLTAWFGETATEIAQENVNMGVGEVVKALSDGEHQTITAEEWINTNLEIGKKVGGGMALLAIPGASVNFAGDMRNVQQAEQNKAFFEALGQGATDSKLQERLPEKFQEYVKNLTEGGAVENIHIPVEQFEEYFQTAGIDVEQVIAELPSVAEQIEQARENGGDLVIPIDEYTTKLAGTEHHAGLVDDLRLRPDELTAREAAELQARMPELVEEYINDAQAQIEAGQAESDAYFNVFENIKQQLIDAGESPTVAHQQAAIIPAFFQTIQQRYGFDALEEFDKRNLSIRTESPVQAGTAPDALDEFIDRVRYSKAPKQRELYGESLLESIANKGGLRDEGGELSARDAHKWHQGKPGQRRFAVPEDTQTALSLDGAREIAIGEGYLAEDATIDDLLALIDNELAGEPVYAEQNIDQGAVDLQNENQQLLDFLEQQGIDFATATNQEIKDAINGVEQAPVDPEGVEYNQDGELVTDSEAFRSWFGESKVVDEDGDPLVVYHGSTHDIEAFDTERGNPENDLGVAFYFTNSVGDVSDNYAGEGPDLTQRIELRAEQVEHDVNTLLDEGGFDAIEQQYGKDVIPKDQGDALAIARQIARKELSGGAPNVMPVYLSMQNPVIIGGESETIFEYEIIEDENGEFVDEAGSFVEFAENLRLAAAEFDGADVDAAIGELVDYAYDGISATNLIAKLKESEGVAYAEIGEYGTLGGNELVRKALELSGFDGIIDNTVDEKFGSSRKVGQKMAGVNPDTAHYLAFRPEQIKSVHNRGTFDPNDSRILHQGKKRGSIQFSDSQTIINLFKARNLSTFLHESGHFFLDAMQDMASRTDTPAELRQEWAQIEQWLGAEPGAKLTTDQHEQWARGFEAYLREGKAPSNELRGAFRKFRDWLLAIYRSIRNLDVKLDDEIRGIFDRMLATDAQIQEAQKANGYSPLFDSAESAGMTEAEFAEYQRVAQEGVDKANEELDSEAIREVLRERQDVWKERREKMRAQVEIEVNQRPDVRAKHFLMRGEFLPGDPLANIIDEPIKINKAPLAAMYEGTDFAYQLRKLPQGKYRITATEGGMHPDEVAELFGYQSGDAFIRALLNVGNRDKIIKQETDSRMSDEHGDMRRDIARLSQMAVDATHNDKRARFLEVELRALNKRTGQGQTRASVAKEAAQRIVNESKVPAATQPAKYLQAERKHARAAEQAIIDNDFEAARDHKRKQLLNYQLYVAARDAASDLDKFKRYFKKFDKASTRKAIKGEHLDQIDAMLEKYDFKQISQKDIARRQALREWIAAREAEGNEVNVSDFILDKQAINFKELQMGELRGLYDSIKNIEYIARNENKLLAQQSKIEFEAAVSEMIEAAEDNNGSTGQPPIDENTQTFLQRTSGKLKAGDASLLKVEQLIAWLDGDKIDGPWRKYIFEPIADAEHMRNDLDKEITTKIIEAMRGLDKEHAKRLNAEKVYVESIGQEFTYGGLIAMALNVGNESNYNKLLKGYGWTPTQAEDAMSHLKKEDWEFVQFVWDTIEELWPHIVELEKSLTGTPPVKVVPRKFGNKHGEWRGGYYPVVYDHRHSEAGQKQVAGPLYEQGYVKATTDKGHTKKRIDAFAAPIKLDVSVIPSHISKVVHDLTHRKAIMDVNKIINNAEIRKTIHERLGVEYHDQFSKWISYVANERLRDESGATFWTGMMRKLRLNAAIVAMGFKWTTMVQQPLGITQSVDTMRDMKDGKLYLAKAVRDFSAAPFETRDFVFEKSGEMRHRMGTLDRDLRENLRQMVGRDDALAEVKRFAMAGIGIFDMTVSLPTWIGSYKWAIDNGYSEKEAVSWADSRVRLSQGTGSAKDLAAVQRDTEFLKLVTVFYSYFNTLYGRLRDVKRGTKSITDMPAVLARSWMLVIVPAIFSEILAGRGPEDDEDPAKWAATMVALYPLATVPILRDVANSVGTGYGYDFTPATSGLEHLVTLANKFVSTVEGETEPAELAEQAFKTSGYFIGLPTAQAAITFGHLWDVATDEDDFSPYKLLYRNREK